jgi:hypothetical protein
MLADSFLCKKKPQVFNYLGDRLAMRQAASGKK